MGKKRTKLDTGSWSSPEQELPATPRSGSNTSALCPGCGGLGAGCPCYGQHPHAPGSIPEAVHTCPNLSHNHSSGR